MFVTVELANGDKIFLKSFNSSRIEEFLDFVKEHDLVDSTLHATGGGAHKYSDIFEQDFGSRGVQIFKHDEMASMVNGLSFVLKYANRSSFSVPSSPTRANAS